MKRYYLLYVVYLIYFSPAAPQTATIHDQLRFKSLTINDGLSHNRVNSICQDHQGFMCFATNEGLNKYDGYTITAYKHDPFDSTSIKENLVKPTLVDHNGNIWLGFIRKGLNTYNRDKDSFIEYKNNKGKTSFNFTYALFEDKNNLLWFGSSDTLFCFDLKTYQIMNFWKLPESHAENTIVCIYEDNTNNLWIGTNLDGLYGFNRESQKFIHFKHKKNNPTCISDNYIETIYQENQATLWKFPTYNQKYIPWIIIT